MLATRILHSLEAVRPQDWDALAGSQPFLRHAFLHALEDTGCVSRDTGWAPRYITLWDGHRLAAAMPLYLKTHSYGEFVFDWAWARAYNEHGLPYYPKLLCAVPFTPVTGHRLLATTPELRGQLLKAALAFAKESRVSSLHVLFPPENVAHELAQAGLMLRTTVQFHWRNAGYQSFDQFLAGMNHDKRKKIKQERRRVREAGVTYRWFNGLTASEAHWGFFCRCYFNTYREHGSSPYLNRDFFTRLARCMPENLLLVIAMLDDEPAACALNIHDGHSLYGRYWGSNVRIPGLHFETCYYQAIEFCIQERLQVFEGGAQGEHKLSRGLLPVETHSAHWIANPGFSQAIERYLQQETTGIGQYVNELKEHSPFKSISHEV
ncbi:MAG: N-acetyltransferase [Betaproteobacteria bacterium]|nr:N-acetyltransferase [Betaproteobacteria bacterium]